MKKCMWIIAALWFITENQFFGWNMTPQSANELVADGIGYVLISLAVMSGRLGATVVITNHSNDVITVDTKAKARKSVPIK